MEIDRRKTKAQLISELARVKQRLTELETIQEYSTLLDKSNDGIIVLQDVSIKFINAKAAAIIGISAKEALGKPFMDFVAPQFKELVIERYKKRLTGVPTPSKYEMAILKQDGSATPVEVNASLIEYKGKPATLSMVRDITERKNTEKALQESEERFFKAFHSNSIPQTIASLPDGRWVEVNDSFLRMVGYSREEVIHHTPIELNMINPEKRSQLFEIAKSGATVQNVEVDVKTKSDTVLTLLDTMVKITLHGSDFILATMVDITSHKQAEKMLQESEEKFRSLAEQSPNMVFINKAGRYEYVNRQFEEILGYRKEELYAPDFDFITLTAPESRDWVRMTFKKHNVDNEDIPPFDFSLITKQGRRIDAILATKLINYKDGKAVVGVITDITGRKQAEEALKLQAELLDAESDAVFLHDFEGNILYVNKAAYLSRGYTREELLSMKLSDLDAPEDAKLIGARMKQTLENGQAVFEVNHLHKNGSLMPVEVRTSRIAVGGKTMILGVAHDITERKQMQSQLIMQDRLASIGQFVSGIAHELNNPLTSVIGFSELLLQKDLPEGIRSDLKIVSDEARRTSTIIKNLLTFARQSPQEKRPVLISDSIQIILQLRSHAHKLNNLTVNTNFAHDLPLVMANNSQLQQVFFNLVSNAEFAVLNAHHKGTITITTRQMNHVIIVSVADDGPGIEPENMKRLFSPFFTTKQPGEGTGLGLSICQGIISEHGGRIWAESEPGKGATFFVELPVCK